jgi:hypothetical protein
MTRKDYILIANVIALFNSNDNDAGIKLIFNDISFTSLLIQALEEDNPNFDRLKFLKACKFSVSDCEDISEQIDWNDQ